MLRSSIDEMVVNLRYESRWVNSTLFIRKLTGDFSSSITSTTRVTNE